MIINHNMSALNASRQLNVNGSNTQKNIEKLSSGLRINRAGDDAAGLAISEKMRGQIRGLDQASRNAQDGISLIQTAEGALNETQSILQRMRELAVQSSNDTNTAQDRSEIQKEINQLTQEIDRIGNTTEFNTKKLLNGGASVAAAKTASVTGEDAVVSVVGGTADTKVGGTVTIDVAGITVATAANDVGSVGSLTATSAMTANSKLTVNGVTFTFGTSDTVQSALDTINAAGIGVTASLSGGNIKLTADTVGDKSKFTIDVATNSFAGLATSTGTDASVTLTGTEATTAEGNIITVQSGNAKGLQFDVSKATTGATTGTITLSVTSNGGLNMQIGANEDQTMYISVGDMRAAALGVNAIDVSTVDGAESAITTVQNALNKVSSERAKLGAFQNRLEHTINNLGTSSENLTAAESRIRDVDMASEMSAYTKNNILAQAAQAMLAQANQQPQQVLQLLR